jgi:iron(III) transport system permease protein
MNSRRSILAAAVVLLLGAAVGLLLCGDSTRRLLANTLWLAGGAAAISLPLGTLLAFLLTRSDLPGRGAALTVLGTMLVVPLFLQASGWDAGFGQLGWFSISTNQIATPLLSTWRAAIWIHALAAIPWVVLIVAAGLRDIEPELEDDARLDGSLWQVFWAVTLPRMQPAVAVAGLWVLVSTASEMTVTDLYRVRTYAEVIYTDLSLGRESREIWWSLLPILLLVSIAGGIVLYAATRSSPAALSAGGRQSLVFRLRRARWPAAGLVAAAVLLIAGVPLANLVWKAGWVIQPGNGGAIERYWSAAKFAAVVAPAPLKYVEEFGWTVAIGVLAATLALIVGMQAAWWARRGVARPVIVWSIAAVCLALPGPLIGLSVIWLWNRDGVPLLVWLYDETIAAPVLAMLIKIFPLATLICWFGWRSIDPATLDSAACDGAGAWTRFWRIAMPQRWLTLAVAWLACLVVSAGDLAATILTVPPDVTTIAIRVFGLVHAGVDYQVAAICLTLAGMLIVAVCIVRWAWGRWQRLRRETGDSYA